jgi:hypothetical protein
VGVTPQPALGKAEGKLASLAAASSAGAALSVIDASIAAPLEPAPVVEPALPLPLETGEPEVVSPAVPTPPPLELFSPDAPLPLEAPELPLLDPLLSP